MCLKDRVRNLRADSVPVEPEEMFGRSQPGHELNDRDFKHRGVSCHHIVVAVNAKTGKTMKFNTYASKVELVLVTSETRIILAGTTHLQAGFY